MSVEAMYLKICINRYIEKSENEELLMIILDILRD